MIDADSGGNEIPSSQYFVNATSLSSFHSFPGFMRSAWVMPENGLCVICASGARGSAAA
jgi:hypothetical protein